MITNGSRLCWLDLEMTGLNVDVDKILEIAVLISDFDNTILFPGITATVHYTEQELPLMGQWVLDHHTKSGLLKSVAESTANLALVEETIYTAIKPFCVPGKTYLAGNSVYQDKIFLKKHMPKLDALFNYRLIDVSTIKVLVQNWYPDSHEKDFTKSKEHRAFKDIQESMAELAHYRKHFFKAE